LGLLFAKPNTVEAILFVRLLALMIGFSEFLLVSNLLILPVTIFVKRARGYGDWSLRLTGYFWTVTLLLWCAVEVFRRWGTFWTVLGLAMGGFGIIPVAFFGLLLSRAWRSSMELYLQCVLILFAQGLSKWMRQTIPE
jgi:hypothetical protein